MCPDCQEEHPRLCEDDPRNGQTEQAEALVAAAAGPETIECFVEGHLQELRTKEPWEAVVDSGCQLTVIGLELYDLWETELVRRGLKHLLPTREECQTRFRFGNGGVLRALFKVEMPAAVFGKTAAVDLRVVAGKTPLLLSRPAMSQLGLTIDFENHLVYSKKLELEPTALELVQNHYVLSLILGEYMSEGVGRRKQQSRLVFAAEVDSLGYSGSSGSSKDSSRSEHPPHTCEPHPTCQQFQLSDNELQPDDHEVISEGESEDFFPTKTRAI
jgi:hypothetical protein